MKETKFWRLKAAKSNSRRAAWSDDMDFESSVVCSVDDGHQRPGKRLPILNIVLPGDDVEDFVWTWQGERVVTERVIECLRREDVTGFDVKPVKARFDGTAILPPMLWEIIVTGCGGIASPESGVRLIEHCTHCDICYYSSVTDPSKIINTSMWDGSDFFTVWPYLNTVFVTDRVARIIRDESFTGVVMQAPGDMDFSAIRTGVISADLSTMPSQLKSKLHKS